MSERRAYAAGYHWRHPAFAFHSTAASAVYADGFGEAFEPGDAQTAETDRQQAPFPAATRE